jgi:hypothetical protein
MNTASNTSVRQQNYMHAVRMAMGLPLHQLANDSLAFCFGQPMDFAVGVEMARIAQAIQKDAIYVSFANPKTNKPSLFSLTYRELEMVDVIEKCVPFAASADAPIALVSIRTNEHFTLDRRGSLIRMQGKPANLAMGKKLAMKRIREAAAKMGDAEMAGTQTIKPGAVPITQECPGSIVRFS